MLSVRKQFKGALANTAGVTLKKKKKKEFTFNVIHFERVDKNDAKTQNNFKRMTSYFNGEFRQIKGLEAVRSQVRAGGG